MGLLSKFLNGDSADLQITDSEYRSPDYNDLNVQILMIFVLSNIFYFVKKMCSNHVIIIHKIFKTKQRYLFYFFHVIKISRNTHMISSTTTLVFTIPGT